MSACDWAADRLTGRLEGVDDGFRDDVALTLRDVLADASLRDRARELAVMAGLVLRLRARARTGGNVVEAWRQGLAFGGAVLIVAHAAFALAAWRGGGVSEPQAAALAAGALVGLFGFALDLRVSGRRVVVLAVALAATALAPQAMRAALPVGMAVVIPIALLTVGWFDPRLAAAATLLVCARLVASGFDELGTALDVLAADGDRVLLVRWIFMGFGVVGAWWVTREANAQLVRQSV